MIHKSTYLYPIYYICGGTGRAFLASVSFWGYFDGKQGERSEPNITCISVENFSFLLVYIS